MIQVTATHLAIEREPVRVMGPVRDERWLGTCPGTVAKVDWTSTSGAFIEIVGSAPEAKQ